MRLGDVFLVFRKEMVDLLRDRRSVLAMFVFPIVIHPILLFGSARLSQYGESKLEREPVTIALAGGTESMRAAVAAAPRVDIAIFDDPRLAVEEGEVDAAVVLPGDDLGAMETDAEPEAVVFYTASRELSRSAKERAWEALDGWRNDERRARLEALGASSLEGILPVDVRNLASAERMAGGRLGRLVPFLIVFLLLNGASFAAVDLFAGERERKTIETLLTSLADRGAVVAGKFMAVVVAAVTATALFLLSSALFTRMGWIGDSAMREGLRIAPLSAVVVLLVSLPLAFFLSAVLVLVSSHAKSYREAQTLLLPAILLSIVPAAFSVAPGVELESIVCVVPIANVAVAVREALVGRYPWAFLALVALSNGLYAGLVLARAKRFFSGESAVLGEAPRATVPAGETRTRAREVMAFYFVEVLVLYYLGSLVQTWRLIPGLLLTLWGFLLVPTLFFARAFGLDFRRDLAFRAPRAAHALAGLLVAPAALLAAQFLFRFQGRFLPVPEEFLHGFEEMAGGGEIGLAALLLAVAVSPGICEEVLFRGLILGQHRRVLSPLRAALFGGLLFGLFHLSIYRIVPTALLGTVAGVLVLRTRSIVPAMLLHVAYNSLTLLAARPEGAWSRLQEADAATVAGAVLLGACGASLLRLRPPADGDHR